jgi:transposase
MRAWRYGLPTNAVWRAIPVLGGAGVLGAAGQKCLILGDHIRANVIGAVCPATGECCTMIFDGVDSDVFQYYLDFLAKEIPALDSKRRVLIVDNASWHKAQRLNWHHFEVHYLPGYSPDFNPIERLWLRLKADFFSDFIAKSPDGRVEKCRSATPRVWTVGTRSLQPPRSQRAAGNALPAREDSAMKFLVQESITKPTITPTCTEETPPKGKSHSSFEK